MSSHDVDLESMSIDELGTLSDDAIAMARSKRAEARERVTAIKQELAGLTQRRSRKRASSAEPEEAEAKPRKSKSGKKKNRG